MPDAAQDVELSRAALEKWVETRRLLSAEERDWALGRELLQDRIGILQQEIALVRKQVVETQAKTSELDTKRQGLTAENEGLKADAAALSASLAELETRTLRLLPRLPEPIQEKVLFLSQQIPATGAPTRLTTGTRFQNTIGVLNEINKFHREITLTSEVRSLGNGRSAEVTALYLGISQGYYTTANGQAAGIGRASESTWTWTPANEEAEQIALAISILEDKSVPAFVQLPIRVE